MIVDIPEESTRFRQKRSYI